MSCKKCGKTSVRKYCFECEENREFWSGVVLVLFFAILFFAACCYGSKPMKVEYKILSEPSTAVLAEKVEYFLNDGWTLVGGVSVTSTNFVTSQFYWTQALTRDNKQSKKTNGK